MARCFQISPPSPQPKYLNYVGQCRTNYLHLISFRRHSWNHVPTLSPSSSHTWQTYLSPRPLFHPNSNWHLSHRCWKKPGLPKSDLANFRPISNLNTIGKILERLALSRFFPHISKSPSFSPLQSAYRKFHSTETALLKLTNDILETIDSGKITILTALDMSAAFDTLDHITLLHRLQHTFGLSGYVISWIRSYLTDRSSFVKIDSSSSPSTTILTGVPQGSVLGPLLFVLFISPIANLSSQIKRHYPTFFIKPDYCFFTKNIPRGIYSVNTKKKWIADFVKLWIEVWCKRHYLHFFTLFQR